MPISEQTTVRIDPAAIPDSVYQVGCSVLNSCIRRALSDPVRRQEYEKWKAKKAVLSKKMSNEE